MRVKSSGGKPGSVRQGSAAVGYGVLVFSGFVLAGALTVFVAISFRSGDAFRTLFHGGLLWLTVRLLLRNLDRLEKGRTDSSVRERDEGAG